MEISLSKYDLKQFIKDQLAFYLPDRYVFSGDDVDKALNLSLERTEYCFKFIAIDAYNNNGQTYFYHLHTDQYSQFLFFLSNSLWQLSENKVLCDKIIVLNRILNGCWFSYKALLPDIFFLDHPVGTVLGNAKYSDFLVVTQNVTVETNYDEVGNSAPYLGKGLFLSAGAKIIGNKPVGDRVSLGVDTVVFNKEIENDSIVYRDSEGKINIKKRTKRARAQVYFNVEFS